MKMSKSEYDELINLQKQYRQGNIKEEDIPEEKLVKLTELYRQQIKLLEKSILEDKREILEIRKKLKSM